MITTDTNDDYLENAIDMDRGSLGSASMTSRDDEDWINRDYFGNNSEASDNLNLNEDEVKVLLEN